MGIPGLFSSLGSFDFKNPLKPDNLPRFSRKIFSPVLVPQISNLRPKSRIACRVWSDTKSKSVIPGRSLDRTRNYGLSMTFHLLVPFAKARANGSPLSPLCRFQRASACAIAVIGCSITRVFRAVLPPPRSCRRSVGSCRK